MRLVKLFIIHLSGLAAEVMMNDMVGVRQLGSLAVNYKIKSILVRKQIISYIKCEQKASCFFTS